MRKFGFSLLLIMMATVTALSQRVIVDQGKPDELKGITKIYLKADDDAAHQSIVKEIKTGLPDLIFTDTPDEADIWLVFNAGRGNVSNVDPASGLSSSKGTNIFIERWS
jgi:hypothetical protein